MINSLAIFGAVTALNSLVAFVRIYLGFAYGQTTWPEASREVFLWVHEASYGLLVGLLAYDIISFTIRKVKKK